jgi:putative Holliday junction resolvase
VRQGIRLGIDVGKVRVGVAQSDRNGMLATPVATLQRGDDDVVDRISALVREQDAIEIVVGLPLALSGAMTASTRDAVELARELDAVVGVPVVMVDERLSTVSAHSALRSSGKKQKQTRGVIDQVAAVLILQHALDTERGTGKNPGRPVADIQLED